MIKRDPSSNKPEETKDAMNDDEDYDSEAENNDTFVQDEYDLANSLDQMVTRLDQFDEYKHLRDKVTQCHQRNPCYF